MVSRKNEYQIDIKLSKDEDFIDLKLCAKEFIDLIDDFKINFLKKKYLILTAYYNDLLVGILISDVKVRKINSYDKIVPKVRLYLLYVNPNFRGKQIGKKLLDNYLKIQKKRGIAVIYIKLPQKYKKGIIFFRKSKFDQIEIQNNKIILEYNLWNDYGITDLDIIDKNLKDVFE
jgi:GNAT superfamily N-acetyltransferase